MKSLTLHRNRKALIASLIALGSVAPVALYAALTLTSSDTWVSSLPANGDLKITGDLSVWKGLDVGISAADATKSAFMLDFYNTTPLPKTAAFDLSDSASGFIWRDSLATTAKNKMSLDSGNTLKLFKADGTTVGLSFNPNTGITLADGTQLNGAASLRSTALYDALGNEVASVAADGKVKFTNGITLGTDPNVKLNASNVAALQATLNNLGYQENPVVATAVKKIPLTNVTVTSVATQGSSTSGNLYVVGHFSGAATIGGFTVVSAGSNDGFVAKLVSGSVQWVKMIGGTSSDFATSVSVDSNGSILVTGNFDGTTTSLGAFNLTSAGSGDGYMAKFDTNGNVLWAKPIGGVSADAASSVGVDSSGNVLVAGNFTGTTTSLGNYNMPSTGGSDGYVAKFDTNNGNVLWAKQIGGVSGDSASSVSVDSGGNVLVAGNFQGTASSLGTSSVSSAGGDDSYVAKFDTNGNVLWAKPIGGVNSDFAYSTTVDSSGSVFVAGNFSASTTNLVGFNLIGPPTTTNGFVVKFNSAGGVLWSKPIGGTSYSTAVSVRLDSVGNPLVGGLFQSATTNLGTANLTSAGSNDGYVVRFNGSNGNVVDSLALGGKGTDSISGMVTWDSDVYAWGATATSDDTTFASSFNFGNARITRGGFLVGWPALSVVTPATVANAKLSWGGSAAPSSGATALGGTAFAGGTNSVALGNGISTGSGSLSSGIGIASGTGSVALGSGTALGSNSVVLGAGTASGSWSIAAGPWSTASGQVSLAGGANQSSLPVSVTGVSSIAWGQKLTVSGAYAQAFGLDHVVTGNNATSLGWGNTAQSAGSLVIGSFGTAQGSATTTVPTDDAFVIGNGTSATAQSSALKTLKNGQTTLINKEWKTATTAAPGNTSTALANPAPTTDSDGEALVVDGHARLRGKVIIEQPQGDIAMGIYGN